MTDGPASDDGAPPEYGPSGYLPGRAAARARKIVLRERMGLHWIIGSILAGVAILALAIPALLATQGAPTAPFEPVGALSRIDPRGDGVVEVADRSVLVLRAGGVLRAFGLDTDGLMGDPPRYCTASGRLEDTGGNVWSLQGRLLGTAGGATASLVTVPAQVYDGVLYLDPTVSGQGLEPRPQPVAPDCGSR